jgi:hypothetical protein
MREVDHPGETRERLLRLGRVRRPGRGRRSRCGRAGAPEEASARQPGNDMLDASRYTHAALPRLFGADHFDPSVRALPFVRGDIFRFTSNGMYVFGFLLLWVPGLWWASAGVLSAALFNHPYIWVHDFATERPDIARIYGGCAIATRS